MNRKALWLSVVVGLQAAWLIGMAASKEINLKRDTIVMLETLPVDPRDWLRGDFVILNYKISTIDANWLGAAASEKLENRTVYVRLEPRAEFYEAVSASLSPMETSSGSYVVQGTLEARGNAQMNRELRVHYGIERFYVPEGTGNPQGKLTVQCVVTSDNKLLIKEALINGRPYGIVMQEASER